MKDKPREQVDIFSTCPVWSGEDGRDYLEHVARVAQWSEEAGCTGMLVYSDNSQVEPWHVAQVIIESTERLSPLVAVQPVYMHPYTLAKKIASLGILYGRRIYLNMVAGGFRNDLLAMGDDTPHDKRYHRLTEYTHIIRDLLDGEGPVSLDGEFYQVDRLKLAPPLPEGLRPGIFLSGSSDAGLAAARELNATAIQYPKPVEEYPSTGIGEGLDAGIRIGIISRPDAGEAWEVAHARFPRDRKGELTHQMAMKVSDSQWHKQLSELARDGEDNPYWLVPFQHYKSMCPYLVGSHEQVGDELQRYFNLGYRTFILDIPADREELMHTGSAFAGLMEMRKAS